jgi:hypothetical protein
VDHGRIEAPDERAEEHLGAQRGDDAERPRCAPVGPAHDRAQAPRRRAPRDYGDRLLAVPTSRRLRVVGVPSPPSSGASRASLTAPSPELTTPKAPPRCRSSRDRSAC